MLSSAIVGIVSGGLPKLLDLWGRKQDNSQELKILQLQAKSEYKTRELEATASVHREKIRMNMSEVESFQKNYSDSLRHDMAAGRYESKTWFGGFMMDLISAWRACMRPAIASTLLFMYCGVRICQIIAVFDSAIDTNTLLNDLIALWGPMDWEILIMAIGYYMTSRGVEKHFKAHQ